MTLLFFALLYIIFTDHKLSLWNIKAEYILQDLPLRTVQKLLTV